MKPSNYFKDPFERGEILSWKSVKPCKNRQNAQRITLEQKTNLAQIPHPSKATFRFPLPGHYVQSNARSLPGVGGGDVGASV